MTLDPSKVWWRASGSRTQSPQHDCRESIPRHALLRINSAIQSIRFSSYRHCLTIIMTNFLDQLRKIIKIILA
jgi:hypothetical protein